MKSKTVLVVGSANLDLVFSCERFPQPGETLLGGVFATHPGGKGANQAVAAGRLGADVQFCGCVGDDANGAVLRQSLEGAGVKLDHLATSQNRPSGTAGILVDANGSNEIVVAPGSNFDVTAAQVKQAIEDTEPRIVITQLEIPMEAVEAASTGNYFILNPAPAQTIPDSILAACDIITPNETELALLTGMPVSTLEEVEAAAETLRDKGVKNVVVTLGSKGSLWIGDHGAQFFEASTVNAVDTTAAGDAFNGALAAFMAQGLTIEHAVPSANMVAALSVTKTGAQESMPTDDEFQAFRNARLVKMYGEDVLKKIKK